MVCSLIFLDVKKPSTSDKRHFKLPILSYFNKKLLSFDEDSRE
jgi:hypothetical protein